MQPRFALSSAPASEPVTLAEAKAHARVGHDAHDDEITAFITAARVMAEKATGRAVVLQTWTATLDRWPDLETLASEDAIFGGWDFSAGLRRVPLDPAPVAAITSVVVDGTTISSSLYALRGNEIWIAGEVADSTAALGGGIVITYTVATTEAGALATFKQAIKMLTLHFYENREAVAAAGVYQAIMPIGVDALLGPFKRFTI